MPAVASSRPAGSSAASADRSWLTDRSAWVIVAAVTLIGLVPRVLHLNGTFIGDELSTLYLVGDGSVFDVIDRISSDAEISPPLYFVLGWAFGQLGDAPALIRAPSLLAYLVLVPLVYAVGARMFSRPAGLVAAAVIVLNPFLVFYSTDARGYLVALALLVGTTLTMLIAVESGRRRWWVAYAALTALAMYAHYTVAFVLLAQVLWLLWAHPEARLAAILANVGAAIAFIPWMPSMLADYDSPTIDILSDLQGDGFEVKRAAVETWAFGYEFNLPTLVPGRFLVTVGTVALVVLALAGLWRWAEPLIRGAVEGFPKVSRPMVLALALTIATPAAELLILGLGGSDLFGARNLNTASPGFALSIGGMAIAAGAAGAICAALILGVFTFGTVRSLDPNVWTINLKAAAEHVDATADEDAVVLDLLAGVLSPVPLTALDAYLPQTREEYRAYLAEGPPPFIRFAPPPRPIVEEALEAAEGRRLFIVAGEPTVDETADPVTITLPAADPDRDVTEVVELPPSWRIVGSRSWEGIADVEVLELEWVPGRAG